MTLWSVKKKKPVSFGNNSVSYIDTVRHARDYKVKYVVATSAFLTRECAHAHERVIAIMAFSLGRLVPRLVGSVVNFRACAVNEF